ncbi:hypothetical protein [Mesoterricola silvestris]|uniref:Phosphate ABC transporter substrate-binding protein n=1 Tax=Mesoterricola silvestris TaxID=2927979 RepID=A0AA48GWM6_9BACT|nr:hypothetical protein [Mesoterricola silvestris]BDU73216.1 hypothetical protein METEAL_23900 [Mesoterricola silvestris]
MRRLLLALALGAALRGQEPLAVIVNPESGVSRLSRTEATNLFMGRTRRLPSGLVALPVEQIHPEGPRARFYEILANLPLPQVRAFWARLYFSGQAQPPRQTLSAEETLQVVAMNRGAIGFVERSRVDRRVRTVLLLSERAEP